MAGSQGDFKFTPEFSATVQAVARGADNSVGIDWAYLSYNLLPNLKLQVGHKRLPRYYYSDFMYIGYAYPWVRPAPDLYGWQTYAYEGANLLYKINWIKMQYDSVKDESKFLFTGNVNVLSTSWNYAF